MRMQIGGNNGQTSKKEGIVVRVLGFNEQGSQVGVTGKNALTGNEVTVWLTDSGICAENKRRKSLKELRDSFKMGRVKYKLEPGGLVHFKGCFAKKDSPDNYISTWANVLGYNAQSVKESVVYIKNAFVRFFKPKEEDTWKPFGYATSFQDKYIVGENIQELAGQIAETRASISNCTLLVRFLDHNGQVLGFLEIGSTKRFDKEKGYEFTPEEYGASCVALIEEQLSNYNDVSSVNILVAKTWSVSREGLLAEGNKKIAYWSWIASHFYKDVHDGENTYRDFFCRDAFGKLSDPSEKQIFINNLHFTGQDGNAVTADPVLLGGLTYAGQEIAPPKTETSVQPKSVVEPEKKETVTEPKGRAVEESPKAPEESPKTDMKDAGHPLGQKEEGRAVENSSSEKTQQQEKVQEPVKQALTQPVEQSKPVTSDDYMDFESALAAGAF